jgi:hypothetical protein
MALRILVILSIRELCIMSVGILTFSVMTLGAITLCIIAFDIMTSIIIKLDETITFLLSGKLPMSILTFGGLSWHQFEC